MLQKVRLLEDDLERVVRFVQVQDASTDRSYLPRRATDHPDGSRSGGLELRPVGGGLWPRAGDVGGKSRHPPEHGLDAFPICQSSHVPFSLRDPQR